MIIFVKLNENFEKVEVITNLKLLEKTIVYEGLRYGCEQKSLAVLVKGTGSRNRKQACYLYKHVAIWFFTDFDGWGESTINLLLKIHQYLCNPRTCESLVCFSTNSRVHLETNTFILRKVVENLCDMAYKK